MFSATAIALKITYIYVLLLIFTAFSRSTTLATLDHYEKQFISHSSYQSSFTDSSLDDFHELIVLELEHCHFNTTVYQNITLCKRKDGF